MSNDTHPYALGRRREALRLQKSFGMRHAFRSIEKSLPEQTIDDSLFAAHLYQSEILKN